MWEQCLRADGRRIADIRVTENLGEVAKQPDAYLKLMGATHGVRPERLETMHFARSALPEIGRKLGFLEGHFEDPVAVGECDDGEAWVLSESCCLTGAE